MKKSKYDLISSQFTKKSRAEYERVISSIRVLEQKVSKYGAQLEQDNMTLQEVEFHVSRAHALLDVFIQNNKAI